MTVPAVATGRMAFPYSVTGLNHVMHTFVKNPSFHDSGWYINQRSGDTNTFTFAACAAQIQEALLNLSGTGWAFGAVVLQKLINGVWISVDSYDAGLSVGSRTIYPATQDTMVLRDTSFAKVKILAMETCEISPQHFAAPSGGDTQFDAFVQEFLPTYGNPHSPYTWVVSRNNLYLADSPFVGMTVTLNRKLRRARGLA